MGVDAGVTTHELKCWPVFFEAIASGAKTFDVRKGVDRVYRVGDRLHLREFDPATSAYSGRSLTLGITYVMQGGPWLPSDTWVLALERPPGAAGR